MMNKATEVLLLAEMAFKLYQGTMVFVNPNKNEVTDLRDIRFIVDGSTKKTYVWDAKEGGTHGAVWKNVLRKPGVVHLDQGRGYLAGLMSTDASQSGFGIAASIKKDYSWLFKYFTNLGFAIFVDAWRV